MKGRIVLETLGSVVLKGNPLGDPRLREVPVYLPPSYKGQTKRYPLVIFLTGFSGTPNGILHPHPWKEGLFERLDRLIAARKIGEFLLAVPDCFTLYGGSQFVNSEGTGRYEDHVVEELVPYLEAKYRTGGGPESRAVMGKSSGGYGSLRLGMRHPGVFGHVVCHSGDMAFGISLAPEFPKVVNALARYGGSFARFMKVFRKTREKETLPHELVMTAALSACYSPNPKSPLGFDLPFDERTSELVPAVWKRWVVHDPADPLGIDPKGLRKLRTLFFDCGNRDEYNLHLAARSFSRTLERLKVPHEYEEHPAGHFDMNPRYDKGFKRLSSAFFKINQ